MQNRVDKLVIVVHVMDEGCERVLQDFSQTAKRFHIIDLSRRVDSFEKVRNTVSYFRVVKRRDNFAFVIIVNDTPSDHIMKVLNHGRLINFTVLEFFLHQILIINNLLFIDLLNKLLFLLDYFLGVFVWAIFDLRRTLNITFILVYEDADICLAVHHLD